VQNDTYMYLQSFKTIPYIDITLLLLMIITT
jgi:hypothetical protein